METQTISVMVFENPEQWLTDNLNDMFVDNIAAVSRVNQFNPKGTTRYCDFEEDKYKECTLQDHIEALKLLCDQIGKTLFVGCLTSPDQLLDAGNWDVEVVDAFYQLVFYKEVIYG